MQNNEVDARQNKKVAQQIKSGIVPKKRRMWDAVLNLTEVEGRTIEAMQLWTRAQTHLDTRIDLLVAEELVLCMDMDDDELTDYTEGMEELALPLIAAAKAVQAYRAIYKKDYHGQ